MISKNTIKLTQYSHGQGCGCKISPKDLDKILKESDNEVYAKMRVKYLLESLPQIGKITALKLMEEIGIDEARRVQGLGSRQKAQILEKLS